VLKCPNAELYLYLLLFHLFLTSALHGDAVNFMPWPLYPQKETQCPLNRRRTFWRQETFLTPTGIRSSDHPARRQSLYQLWYPGSRMPFPEKCSSCKYLCCCCCSKCRRCRCKFVVVDVNSVISTVIFPTAFRNNDVQHNKYLSRPCSFVY
jgi:hypothetical protein